MFVAARGIFAYLFIFILFSFFVGWDNRTQIFTGENSAPCRVVGLYTSGQINVALCIEATQPCEFVVVWPSPHMVGSFPICLVFHAGSQAKYSHSHLKTRVLHTTRWR